ncbi:RNase adapter RapZ [Entomomonas sp. E2T0]|uniref:RNase adapter RapZ n=1 Tax=Entomomonas sp. E2T0 TaxID=2930213 RepID=UPI00222810F0|nr:RNase adapter RapZ [Entomomonas sp. E2T0]UYZ85142.1 RNase adapter RapZ [Entomomonas sp. E2T0]
MRLVIVSGRSGSGKTTALHLLEDNGFYCIDNLPASLFTTAIEQALLQTEIIQPKIAVSIDARSLPRQIESFPSIFERLSAKYIKCDLVYLDAKDEILISRFSETRRRHPLTTATRSLAEAIDDESKLLAPIINLATLHVDTSQLNVYQLKDFLKLHLLEEPELGTAFLIESFGFKRGIPMDADWVFDLRSLPNPYWVAELRNLKGTDQPVIDYLIEQPEVLEMQNDILVFLEKWLPRFAATNRSYITVAVGCTGGQHRSVYMAEQIGKILKTTLKNVQVRHRDLL